MKNIKVTLLHHTPLYIASDGARTCWSSQDKSDTSDTIDEKVENYLHFEALGEVFNSPEDLVRTSLEATTIGPKDLALIDRVGNQYHHASILEHITFNFFIDGISRACLQELARHRIASLSVKSSRYTISELRKEQPFTEYTDIDDQEYLPTGRERAEKYLVMTTDERVNRYSILALDNLRDLVATGMSNDLSKYAIPESYRTQLTWSINMRSLQNFLSLRTDRKALPEIQHLANLIYETLPTDAQSLVAHCVSSEIEKQKKNNS